MSVPQIYYDVMRLKRAALAAPKPTGWTWQETLQNGAYQLRKDGKYEGVLYMSPDTIPPVDTILDELVARLNEHEAAA